MKNRRALGLLVPLLATAAMTFLAGCRTAPIESIENAPISPSQSVTDEEIAEVIWRAGRSLGWIIEEAGPGELVGTLAARNYVAAVSITYKRTSFSIRYKDSVSLRHRGDRIHRRYNHWVRKLATRIQREMRPLGYHSEKHPAASNQ